MNVWILTLLVGSAIAAPSLEVFHHGQTRNLAGVIVDILEKTGIKDLLPWVQEKFQTDPELQSFINYMESGKLDAILNDLRACPGYNDVKEFLNKEGVDIVKLVEEVRKFFTGKSYYKIQPRQNLGDFLNEFLSRVDINLIITVVKDKLDNDPDLKKAIEYAKGPQVKKVVDCMKNSKAVKELKEKLLEEGIDIESIIEMIKMLSGGMYYHDTRNIADTLHNLIEDLGLKDLLPWLQEQIQTDPDVQRVIAYLQSPAFKRIEDHLKKCPGYQETKDKLKAEGIDLAEILEKIRNFISGNSFHAKKTYYKIQPRRTLGELLDALIEKLNIDHMIQVINDKYRDNPDLKKVTDFLKGETMKGIRACMKESKDVQDLIKILNDEGVDVQGIIDMIDNLLESADFYYKDSRKVIDFLHQLSEDLGLKALLPWIQEMIQTDPDVQRVIEYLQSPAFKRIEDHLKSCPGYQETKDKLKAEGIDLVEILEKIRNFIAGNSYHAKKTSYKIQPRRTLGELLDEILEKLDIQKMIKIIREKYHGNADLKKVTDFLKSDTMKGIRACMKESKDVQELIVTLNDEGVDVQGIIEMIESLLEEADFYYKDSRKVIDFLHQLSEDLGLKDLLPWIQEMIQTDPDVQRVIEYLQSPAFKRIEEHLKTCPGYKESKEALLKEGIDLAEILEKIRDFIAGNSRTSYKIQPRRTLGELLDEIIKKLDVQKMISIIKDKYHGNPDLKKVIDFLKSDTLKGIRACMKLNPDVQDLIEALKEEDIDVQAIIDLIDGLLENAL